MIGSADKKLEFFVGLHQPSDAQHFAQCCISVTRLLKRKSHFAVGRWIMDSGAFQELFIFGHYRHSVAEYAATARRWLGCGDLLVIVSQDYMCEPIILKKTGLTVAEHQRLTIERFDELQACGLAVPILPTLQGYEPQEYAAHVEAYGDRLAPGSWVGVGSVCKRNGSPIDVFNVLAAIAQRRPDLKLHGFGVKLTALAHPGVRKLLHSADSMGWSFSARKQGRNGNDWHEAKAFEEKVIGLVDQPHEAWQLTLEFGHRLPLDAAARPVA